MEANTTTTDRTELETTLTDAGLGPQEARAYILRDIEGVGRADAAETLEKNPNTIDSQVQAARKKLDAMQQAVDEATIPRVSKLDRYTQEDNTIVRLWFENGAFIGWRHIGETGEIREECGRPQDNGTVFESHDVSGGSGVSDSSDVDEYATVSLSEYLSFSSPDDLRYDWGTPGEVILGEA
jgi:predicted DNA-binding protein (UPF0251 family)